MPGDDTISSELLLTVNQSTCVFARAAPACPYRAPSPAPDRAVAGNALPRDEDLTTSEADCDGERAKSETSAARSDASERSGEVATIESAAELMQKLRRSKFMKRSFAGKVDCAA